MTNSELLRTIIEEKGLKLKYVAQKIGLTPHGLSLKIDNASEFKSSEIKALCELLGINDLNDREAIFFAEEVAK